MGTGTCRITGLNGILTLLMTSIVTVAHSPTREHAHPTVLRFFSHLPQPISILSHLMKTFMSPSVVNIEGKCYGAGLERLHLPEEVGLQ